MPATRCDNILPAIPVNSLNELITIFSDTPILNAPVINLLNANFSAVSNELHAFNRKSFFSASDVLEYNYEDIRTTPLHARRKIIETLKIAFPMVISPEIIFDTWQSLTEKRTFSRENFAEGIMLKRKKSAYEVGRKKGNWWKWKVDPYAIDAVLIYAQKGSGRRADLYTDYTFAVWDNTTPEKKLVIFAKAYSGLTDKEIREVDNFVKRNTLEKFGPVRTVTPKLVFEIGFEGISLSGRHKSGVAVRFPRMLRWRKDKTIEEANTLDDLKGLL